MPEQCGPRFPGSPGRDIPSATRLAVFEIHGTMCAYCLTATADSIDHLFPYSQGGSHDAANLVPACRVCNSILGSRVFPEFAAKRAYVLARREQIAPTTLARAYLLAAAGRSPRIE